jgi:hypothetical protein
MVEESDEDEDVFCSMCTSSRSLGRGRWSLSSWKAKTRMHSRDGGKVEAIKKGDNCSISRRNETSRYLRSARGKELAIPVSFDG